MANNNYTIPKIIGTTKENTWEAKANLMWNICNNHSLFAEVSYYDRSIDGIEYIQEWNNTYEESKWEVISKNIRSNFSTKRISAKIDYMEKKGNSYGWWAGIEIQNEKLSDIYYLPLSTQNVENLYLMGNLKYNFIFGKNAILVGTGFGCKLNQASAISYTGNYADSDIYKNMVLRDFYYLSSSALYGGLELGYTRGGLFKSNSSFFVNMKANLMKPENIADSQHSFTEFGSIIVKAGLTF